LHGATIKIAKNIRPAEISRQIFKVNGYGGINEVGWRKWRLLLKEDRTKLHDEVPSGRPSLVVDDLKENVPILHQVSVTCFSS